MEYVLNELGKWLQLFAPITAGIGLFWKYWLKPKLDEMKQMSENVKSLLLITPKIQQIEAEMRPNGGSSLRDSINRIEQRLLLHDQKIMAMIKSMPYGTWLSDKFGKCIDVNIALCTILDRSESEIKGDNWTNWLVDKVSVTNEWKRCVDNGIDFDMEYEFIKPDRTIVKVHGAAIQLKGVTGELLGFVGKIVPLEN